jgi:hypothetical protein
MSKVKCSASLVESPSLHEDELSTTAPAAMNNENSCLVQSALLSQHIVALHFEYDNISQISANFHTVQLEHDTVVSET